MIDVENQVYAAVSRAVKAEYSSAFTAGEYVDTPSKFPAVLLFQADSSVVQRMRTADSIENADQVMFSAYVFSNKVGYKKAEASAIMDIVDETMAKLGFTRTSRTPVSNLADATIYQIAARYEAVLGKNGMIYTN